MGTQKNRLSSKHMFKMLGKKIFTIKLKMFPYLASRLLNFFYAQLSWAQNLSCS